ncbi:MAG TPA: class I SAM-dependent methyltransferase [Stellaceae bacterium]|nr:class I SAM-dependent methyltransferase [Stellaceae bacterium]
MRAQQRQKGRRTIRPDSYRRLAEREERYWWHRARRRMAVGLLRKYGLGSDIRAVDIACGCGGNFQVFDLFKPKLVAGIELSPIALGYARRKAPEALLVRADLNADAPFSDESFDVATVFNAFYHEWVKDDRAMLRRIGRLLRPGGLLVLTEPAFEALRREMDRAAMGRRRYTLPGIRELAESAGLEFVFGSYFSSFVFPLALGMGIADRVRSRRPAAALAAEQLDLNALGERTNESLYRLAAWEADAIVRGLRVPFGVTLVAVLRRSGGGLRSP